MSLESMPLRSGLRLASQVCATEIIVVRPGSETLSLWCGGVPMRERGSAHSSDAAPEANKMRGSLLGKRYTHPEDSSLEVLVTAGGEGTLSAGGHDLVVKETKPLPASD